MRISQERARSFRTYLSIYNFRPQRVPDRRQDYLQYGTIRLNGAPMNGQRASGDFRGICLPGDYLRYYRQITIHAFDLLDRILEGDWC